MVRENIMTGSRAYRYAEKCMYEYNSNTARLNILLEDLKDLRIRGDVRIQNYEISGNNNNISSPVIEYIQHVELLEREIKHLQRIINPLTHMYEDLKKAPNESLHRENLIILEEYYFSGIPEQEILNLHKWSHSTFYRKRASLVRTSIKYLGL